MIIIHGIAIALLVVLQHFVAILQTSRAFYESQIRINSNGYTPQHACISRA